MLKNGCISYSQEKTPTEINDDKTIGLCSLFWYLLEQRATERCTAKK